MAVRDGRVLRLVRLDQRVPHLMSTTVSAFKAGGRGSVGWDMKDTLGTKTVSLVVFSTRVTYAIIKKVA